MILHTEDMSDHKTLVNRLLTRAVDYKLHGRPDTARICNEAAEALTALQAQLLAETIDRQAAKNRVWELGLECDKQDERIKELEAKSDELGKQNYRLINELAAAVDRAQKAEA